MKRPLIVLVAGLVAGLLGAGLVAGYVRSIESAQSSEQETSKVLVATAAITTGTPAGTLADSTRVMEVPTQWARPGAIESLDGLAGQFTLGPIAPGETLTSGDFGAAGQTAGQLPIPAGREAVAVAVALDGGVGRYPRPGDQVSVYATFREGEASTHKILAGIPVLATRPDGSSAGRVDSGAEQAPASGTQLVYVLAVTPDEAAQLVHGRQTGQIWLSLVPEGQASPPVAGVTTPRAGGGK